MQAVNATFVFPDDGTYCKNFMGPGYPDKTFVMVGKDTPISLINKNLSDSSNTFRNTNLIIDGKDMPIQGEPVDGSYIGVDSNGVLRFMNPIQVNIWGMTYVNSNYTGEVSSGLPDAPYKNIGDAVKSLPSTGGIINIIEGEYTENVTIDANVDIVTSNSGIKINGDVIVENNSSAKTFKIKDMAVNGNITVTSKTAINVIAENMSAHNLYVGIEDVSSCTIRNSYLSSLNAIVRTILLDKTYMSGQANLHGNTIDINMTTVEVGVVTHKYGSEDSNVKIQWSKITSLNCNDATLMRDAMSYSPITGNNFIEKLAPQGAIGMHINNVRIGNLAALDGSKNTIIGAVPSTATNNIGQTILGHHDERPITGNALFISPTAEHIITPGLQGMTDGVPMVYNIKTGEMNYLAGSLTDINDHSDIGVNASLQVIDELRPRTFTWNETGNNGVGLLAEEVPEEFAAYGRDGTSKVSVKYLSLIPHMITTMKYMRTEIIDLKNKLRETKSALSMLKKK